MICRVVTYLVKYDICFVYHIPVRYTYHLHYKSEKDHHTRRSLGESWLSLLRESSGPEACFLSSPLSPEYKNNHNWNPSLTFEVTPILAKPTPECTVHFEKLILAQLTKKFHIFYDSLKVHYCVQKSTPWIPILSHMNLVQTFLYIIKDKKLLHI